MLYTESGHLSEDGKKRTEDFRKIVKEFLLEGGSENEVRLIGSLLVNEVANQTSLAAVGMNVVLRK